MDRSIALALSPLAAFLGGCLLLSSHDGAWPCNDDSDCHADERCLPPPNAIAAVCVDKSTCRDSYDCDAHHVCRDNKCVQRDCTDQTSCGVYSCDNDAGACRTSCTYPSDCADGYACSDGACTPGTCTGQAAACASIQSSYDCTNNGCSYREPSSLQCTGYAATCGAFFRQDRCEAQLGCGWSGTTCQGTPDECGAFTSSGSCQSQVGCSWDSGCTGNGPTCASLKDYGACSQRQGCTWQ